MKIDYSLEHIQRLTNKVGIIEHAYFTSPNLKEGYSVDDNARAMLVCEGITGKDKKIVTKLLPVYENFLIRAMDKKGWHQDLGQDMVWKNGCMRALVGRCWL